MSNLAKWMPFPDPLRRGTQEAKFEHLKKRAVSLTCPGFTRVFASRHASIQEKEDGSIRTFGVYLTVEQEQMCDGIEALGFNKSKLSYYDKVTVPVIIHRDGQADTESTANVYRMTQNRVDE